MQKASGWPEVSIIVPVHNGGESFRKCLQSLNQWALERAEVIVVADGASDGSWQLAEPFGAKLIRLPETQGPARARNIGAEAAEADILFFVDADVTIHPNTVDGVIRAFQDNPELAALIGSYDDAPGATNFLSQYKNLFHHYTHQGGHEEASTFWGACGAVRREIFLSLGGFDQRFRKPCIEDIELGYRLKQAGYQIRLCKAIQVKHLKHWTPYSLLRADIFYRALPWTALLLQLRQTDPQQYQQVSRDLNLKSSSRLSVVLVYAAIASLLFVWWWPTALLGAGLLSLVLVLLNWPVYRFFYQQRGFWFALGVIPWHWLYYFYSGLAFAIGHLRYQIWGYQLAKG